MALSLGTQAIASCTTFIHLDMTLGAEAGAQRMETCADGRWPGMFHKGGSTST